MSTIPIDYADLLRQRRLQELMDQADQAVVPSDTVIRTTSFDQPTITPPSPTFQPPVQTTGQTDDSMLPTPPTLRGVQLNSPETVPRALQPVAPIGRVLATPPAQFQVPPEVTSAEKNLSTAADITEDPISKKRRLAAILAGIGTGFAGGPLLGKQVYGDVVHAPYNAKVEPLLRKQALLDRAAKLSLEAQKNEMEGARTESDTARDYAEEARSRTLTDRLQQTPIEQPEYKPHTQEEFRQVKEIEEGAKFQRASPTTPVQVRLKDKSVVRGAFWDPERRQYMFSSDGKVSTPIDPKQIESVDPDVSKDISGDTIDQAIKAEETKMQRPLTTAERANIYNQFQKPPDPTMQAIHELTLSNLQSQQNPQNVSGLVDQIGLSPKLAQDKRLVTPKNANLVATEHMARYKLPLPIGATPQQTGLQTSAIRTKEYLNTIDATLKKYPELSGYMGSLAGGLVGRAEVAIGQDILQGAPPEIQTAAAELRNMVKYVLASESSNAGQGRAASKFMIDLLRSTAPDMKMSPTYFQGALRSIGKAADDNLNAVNQEIYGQSYMVPYGGIRVPRLRYDYGRVYVFDEKTGDYVKAVK